MTNCLQKSRCLQCPWVRIRLFAYQSLDTCVLRRQVCIYFHHEQIWVAVSHGHQASEFLFIVTASVKTGPENPVIWGFNWYARA
jgi:hypothetical protein